MNVAALAVAVGLGARLFPQTQRPFVRPNPPFAAFRWSALKWAAIMARVFRDARVPEIL